MLGFTPYRLHKNVDGTFVTPIRVYDGKVYVLDDVTSMEVGDRYLTTDGRSGVALQGDRGLKGDSGDKGPTGNRGLTGKRVVEGPKSPAGKIGKMEPVGSRGGIEARREKGDKGGGVGQQGLIDPPGSTGPRGVQGAKGLRGVTWTYWFYWWTRQTWLERR